MFLLAIPIVGALIYTKFYKDVVFISYGFANFHEFVNFSTELQEKIPEYRVYSGLFKPSTALYISLILLLIGYIQFSFNGLIKTIWKMCTDKKNGRNLLLTFALLILFILWCLIEIDIFEVTFEGYTIYSKQYYQEVPNIDDLVDIIKEKSSEIRLPALIFAFAPFIIAYRLLPKSYKRKMK
ncbi:uncharacterized protein LOC108114012 [Drosophila eugracilis]|uniref:uncharacterized protein LOC108114012 n=1 Tax=Drosophila eugracilis TaxID=29029 RepID=UPI0007E816D4|nr:uncharacterized protein LOC108114012 [Drosophila eugracilis]